MNSGSGCSTPARNSANSLKKTSPSSSSKGSETTREQYLYLTTRGRKSGLSREIEIWFTQHDGRFFVIAEYPTSNWVQNLRAYPRATLRVAQEKFEVQPRFLSPEDDAELYRTIAGL